MPILFVIDSRGTSRRAAAYLASILGRGSGFAVRLLHLREPGGLEDRAQRAVERRRRARVTADRALREISELLRRAGVPAGGTSIEVKANDAETDIADTVLLVARRCRCRTIVVPRGLATDLAQMLLSRDHPFTIWAVG
jgi:hypothetical protein